MLSKLLKHEFRATGRVILPVYVLMAASAGLMNLFLFLTSRYDSRILRIFNGIFIFTFVVSLIGAAAVTLVLMVLRFYRNYMTDEGYLMFTLPVTTPQLIWSKLIAALVWSLATGLVMALVLGLTAFLWRDSWSFYSLRDLFSTLFSELSQIRWTRDLILVGTLLLVGVLSSYLLFYASIAVGHSFSNHKGALSVAFYILFSVVQRTILTFTSVSTVNSSLKLEVTEPAGFAQAVIQYSTLRILVFYLASAAVFYLLTRFFMNRKLNLQ